MHCEWLKVGFETQCGGELRNLPVPLSVDSKAHDLTSVGAVSNSVVSSVLALTGKSLKQLQVNMFLMCLEQQIYEQGRHPISLQQNSYPIPECSCYLS